MIELCTIITPLKPRVGVHCPQCNRILHPSMFRRKLSEKQARARLVAKGKPVPDTLDGVYLGTYGSKVCTDCAPSRVKSAVKTMTARQLHNAVMEGRVRASVAELAIPLAEQRANRRKSDGVKRRWAREWAVRWHFAREKVRVELRQTAARIQYTKTNPPREGAEELLSFLVAYRQTLRLTVQWFTLRAREDVNRATARRVHQAEAGATDYMPRRGRPRKPVAPGRRDLIMDKRSVWSDYIMPGQMDGLTSLLDEIPTDARIQRLSAMPLLLDRRPDRQLCLYGYDEVGQQEKADAEDRLSILGE